ncbi:hypothetical protein BD311DRAFT_780324 [Dichomitus squalens]|uniref:Uncharacterized protein n=1 Tax=Dichomitus squalens TaxID=114155 RepID=A0A4Q9MHR1_9APHY|nr:hypothetical protein BD311DRAFT_780324 [Dichomitus squalens]
MDRRIIELVARRTICLGTVSAVDQRPGIITTLHSSLTSAFSKYSHRLCASRPSELKQLLSRLTLGKCTELTYNVPLHRPSSSKHLGGLIVLDV